VADLSKTIQIIFDGVDNTAGAFGAVAGDLDALAGDIESATQPFADLTKGLLAAEAAAAAVAVGFATLATQAAGEFSDSFREISTLVDASDESLAGFKTELQAYASTSTQSFADITKATYNAISAGVDYEDAIGALTVAERLAVATKSDLNGAMEALVPTMNAYGAGMEQAGTYSDILFTAVKSGKTTLPELSASLSQVTGIAASAGVPFSTLAAAVADLTAEGAPTSQAITSIKAALSNIIKPSTQAAEEAERLGIAFNAQALETKGLEGLLKELEQATGGNITEMGKFFGSTEALNAVMGLLNDESSSFTVNLEKMAGSTGATDAAFDKMAASFELTNRRIKNASTDMLISAGEPLLESWSGIGGAIADIFLSLGDSFDEGAFDDIYLAIEGFGADIEAALLEVAENLPEALAGVDWTEFLGAMEGLGESISGLFGDVDLTTAEGLETVIQALVDTGTGLVQTTGSIIEVFGPLFDVIGDAISYFNSLDTETKAAIGTFLGVSTAANTVAGALGPLFGTASSLAGVFGKLAASGSSVVGALGATGAAAGGAVAALGPLALAVGSVAAMYKELSDNTEKFGNAGGVAVTTTEAAIPGFRGMGDVVGLAADALLWLTGNAKDAHAALGPLGEGTAEVSDDLFAFGGFLDQTATALDKTVFGLSEYDKAVIDASGSQKGLINETDDLLGVTHGVSDAMFAFGGYLNGTATAAEEASVAAADLATSTDEAGVSAELTAEKAADLELEWAKLASQERSLMFQAAADIETARIEADAQTIIASMEMMSAAFESTGEVLGDLFALWEGVESVRDQSQIEEWIEREYEMREKLAEAQIKLVEAEIEKMRAHTAILEQGGVELKITSDGLEPELEAFMFRVIDKVRVSIAGSYEQFLIGAGCEAA
jgi:TP901 family phage tail tape measure protein